MTIIFLFIFVRIIVIKLFIERYSWDMKFSVADMCHWMKLLVWVFILLTEIFLEWIAITDFRDRRQWCGRLPVKYLSPWYFYYLLNISYIHILYIFMVVVVVVLTRGITEQNSKNVLRHCYLSILNGCISLWNTLQVIWYHFEL